MSFIYDNTGLPATKSDLTPLGAGDPTKHIVAADWNTVSQALLDTRDVLRGAVWIGLSENGSDPAPVGVPKYIWADNAGRLFLKDGGSNVELTALGTGARLVYRPGSGLTGPVVYDTFAACVARIVELRAAYGGAGEFDIVCDGSMGTLDIPSGDYAAAGDLDGVTLRGLADIAGQQMTVAEGVTLISDYHKLSVADNLTLLFTGTTPAIELGDETILDVYDRGAIESSGAGPLAEVTPGGATVPVVNFRDGGTLRSGSTPSVRTNFGSSPLVVSSVDGKVEAAAMSGAAGAGSIIVDYGGVHGRVDPNQPALLSTLETRSPDRVKWHTEPGPLVAAAFLPVTAVGKSVLGDTSGGAFDLTMPFASGAYPGESMWLYQVAGSAGQLGIAPRVGDTINGLAAPVKIGSALGAFYICRDVRSSSNWIVRELALPGTIGTGGGGGGANPVIFEGTLGSDATTWSIPVPSGDGVQGGLWEFYARIVIIDSATDDFDLEIRPNGVNTGLEGRYSNLGATSAPLNRWRIADRLGGVLSADLVVSVTGKIFAKRAVTGGTNRPRFFKSTGVTTSNDGVSTSGSDQHSWAYLHDVSAPLTSLEWVATVTGTMKAESYCAIWQMAGPTY